MAAIQQLDNFYLSETDLAQSPSREDGVDAETEKRLRFYGCQRIQRAVVLLGVPQVVAATAQTLLHRFYCKRSLRNWHIRVRFEFRGTSQALIVLAQGCNSSPYFAFLRRVMLLHASSRPEHASCVPVA